MKKNDYLMSLRSTMMLVVGGLVLVALLFSVSDLQQSYAIYRSERLIAERIRLADVGVQAIKDFAFERGRSNIVLRGKASISDENHRFISERRIAADAKITQLIARFPETMNRPALALESAWAALRDLRSKLDDNFSKPLLERDAPLAGQWLVATDNLMAQLENVLLELSQSPSTSDARYERLSALRMRVVQLRSIVGAESTTLAAELSSGQLMRSEVLSKALVLRGRSQQLWLQIVPGVERLAITALSAPLEKVADALFGTLRPLQDEILRAAAREQRPTLAISRYLAVSVPALESVVELADAIGRELLLESERHFLAAERRMLFSLSAIALVLGLAAFIVMLLVKRFVRPLMDIEQSIRRLLAIQQTPTQNLAERAEAGDEFSHVRTALEHLGRVLIEQQQREAALHESERVRALILTNAPLSIIATDLNGLIAVFNPGAEKMLGYTAEEVVGQASPALIHDPEEVRRRADELSEELGFAVTAGFEAFVAKARQSGEADEREWTYVCKNGARITVLLSIAPLFNAQGEIDGFLGVASDITQRTLAAEEIRRMAHYDLLTHLPNRQLYHDRMQVALRQARRENGHLALMLIDLDKFKPVNDHLGHAVGDLLLKAATQRMQACLRESDTLARIGGDEFVVILTGINSQDDALGVADKIRCVMSEPFMLDGGYKISISASVGVAIYPEHGQDEKLLSKSADEAMYRVKETGRNGVQIFQAGASAHSATAVGHELSVVRLVWRKSYKCGEESIDREHRQLFDLSNELINTVYADESSPEQINTAMENLIVHAEQHFEHEERILASYHYAQLDNHALKHQSLRARARDLRAMAADRELEVGALVAFVVQDLVARHLLKDDRDFFPFLKKVLDNPASKT